MALAHAGPEAYIYRMKHVFTIACLTACLAGPVQAEKLSLNDLSSYMTELGTVETTFTQINSDGSLSTGKLAIQRPGRMRFEYDPPNLALVIAGGGQLAIFDPVSNEPPEQYPLSQTPLNLILQRNVDFNRSEMVVSHFGDDTATRIVAQDPDHPELGTIELVFSPEPVELRQWVITNEGGDQTTVILGALEDRDSLSSFLFNIPYVIEERLK